jgi:hypothetical protein
MLKNNRQSTFESLSLVYFKERVEGGAKEKARFVNEIVLPFARREGADTVLKFFNKQNVQSLLNKYDWTIKQVFAHFSGTARAAAEGVDDRGGFIFAGGEVLLVEEFLALCDNAGLIGEGGLSARAAKNIFLSALEAPGDVRVGFPPMGVGEFREGLFRIAMAVFPLGEGGEGNESGGGAGEPVRVFDGARDVTPKAFKALFGGQ